MCVCVCQREANTLLLCLIKGKDGGGGVCVREKPEFLEFFV